MNDKNDRDARCSRYTRGFAALAGVMLMIVAPVAFSAELMIEEDYEAEMTGVIESLEGDKLTLEDAGFEMVPTSRVLTRNGRELESFHLNKGQEVEIHYDPRYEPRKVIDIILLRRGG